MRFHEFSPKQTALDEGGKSSGVRYNSEVAIMCAMVGANIEDFDPNRPEKSLPAELFDNPKRVYADIKKLLANDYDEDLFRQWYEQTLTHIDSMYTKLEEYGGTLDKVGWAGGANQAENAADIAFVGHPIAGISVKAEGGITLANLTPKSVGLEPEKGDDIFYHYAQSEYVAMKRKIFKDVLDLAREQPGVPLVPIKDKYSVTYDPQTDQFICLGSSDKGPIVHRATEQDILIALQKNALWQRPFGDWFQVNWQAKKSYATPLFTRLAKEFERVIENHLQDSSKLSHMLRFAKEPYFYFNKTGLYFVPTKDDVADLQLRGLKYGEPDGTSQLFIAEIGRPNSTETASLDIYIRYANGMFAANPTVRVQTLRNPQFIGWEKLA
jgi:hypothetical protein